MSDDVVNGQLSCGVCGAKTSRRGTSFTAHSLAIHKARAHRISLKRDAEDATETPGRPSIKLESQQKRQKSRYRSNHVKFCPRCGCNLEVVNAALSLIADNEVE